MKKFYLLIFIVTILISCSKEEEIDPQFANPSMEKNADLKQISKQASVLNDSIIPLNPEDFPDIDIENNALSTQTSVFSDLYQLDGIEFFIKSKYSYFGNNTLQSTGKGNEVVLASYSTTNDTQLFYLQFLPASTGVIGKYKYREFGK